jgi:hypothetical protein
MTRFIRHLRNGLTTAVGFVLVVSAMAGQAVALVDVPEINPGSLASAVTLLLGGVYLLTDRIRRR